MHLGESLRELRESQGFTQTELAEAVGDISQHTISNYELGYRQPNPRVLRRIASVLGVTVDYLLGGRSEARQLQMPMTFFSHLPDSRYESIRRRDDVRKVVVELVRECLLEDNAAKMEEVDKELIHDILCMIAWRLDSESCTESALPHEPDE